MKVEYSLKDYVISVRNLIEALDRPAEDLELLTLTSLRNVRIW